MFKSLAPLFAAFAFLLACNNDSKTETKKQDTTTSPDNTATTNDTVPKTNPNIVPDEHGCLVDAGERWSLIKKSCVNLPAKAFKAEPKDPALDPAKPAYFLFDSVRVELFLPTQVRSVVIRRSSAEGEPPVWANGPLKLTLADDTYTLYDEEKILYQVKKQ